MEDRQTRLLRGELHRLAVNFRRKQAHMIQEKNKFLRNQNLPPPTILMARPESPVARYESPNALNDVWEEGSRPSYMRQTKSSQRSRSTMATIDMFTLKSRKKLNTWEEPFVESAEPKFVSKVHPSMPLTSEDQLALQRDWEARRQKRAQSASATSMRKRSTTPAATKTFITQLGSNFNPMPVEVGGQYQTKAPVIHSQPTDGEINPKPPVVTFSFKKNRVQSSRLPGFVTEDTMTTGGKDRSRRAMSVPAGLNAPQSRMLGKYMAMSTEKYHTVDPVVVSSPQGNLKPRTKSSSRIQIQTLDKHQNNFLSLVTDQA